MPALEKRYVNKVVFGIYDAAKMTDGELNPDALLESYTFKFGSISEGDYVKVWRRRERLRTVVGRKLGVRGIHLPFLISRSTSFPTAHFLKGEQHALAHSKGV